MYTLEKKFRFESAHRLAKNYEGKCSSIHGHSWNGKVTVCMERLNFQGMAVDFSVLGEFTKQLDKEYDHKLFLFEEDTDYVQMMEVVQTTKVVLFTDNPTSEVLARTIYGKLHTFLTERDIAFDYISVTVDETCTSSCTFNTGKSNP